MKNKKLLFKKHNEKELIRIVDKCCAIIDSCSTEQQLEVSKKYSENAFGFVWRKEHLDDYTKLKLFIFKHICRHPEHEEFIKNIKNQFDIMINNRLNFQKTKIL